ncbi:MAG TPA: hypothetical protein VK851_09880 [Anaerolineales bacterium]|nr:hypothetical protein [Anaerolineales bacterium]
MTFARLGAVSYIIWGLLHILAAFQETTLAGSIEPGLVPAKLNQGAWDLLFFALFAIGVAIKYNWRNDLLGYWLNLIVVSAADIGFVVFVLLPGHVALFPGILGPIFWVAGLLFTTLGIASRATV